MAIIDYLFNSLGTQTTGNSNLLLTLLLFTAILTIYSICIYYFYIFLAKRNLIEINLNKYNKYENPAMIKIFAFIFYIIEYIILLPIMTLFWFAILSVLILILAEGIEVNTILLISAAFVASVRATSYINEDLSKDLAKMVPLTLLAIALTKPGFFNVTNLLSRISEIPSLLSNVPAYLIFIIAVELIMRGIEFLISLFSGVSKEESEVISEE